ncbi:MAG: tetratricopeptide repeat protein [Syntrophomonadaceae bacterium]
MDKKKIGIVALLAVVLAVGIGAVWWLRGTADRAQEKLDLAVKYISENDFDKAILAYNDAIKIDSKQVKAYQGLAKVYTLQGKYDEAKAVYDKGAAAVAASDQNTLRMGLAGMYIDKGQLTDAEKAFREIINGSQNCLEAYWGLTMVYQKQGDNTKAEAALRQAVEKYPENYRGYNTLALFLKQNGKADEAFSLVIKSLTLELNQQEAYLVLSDIYNGHWSDLRPKLTYATNQKIAAMLEFYSYYSANDFSKAMEIYKTKTYIQDGNQKVKLLTAIAMVKAGDKANAESLISQLFNENLNKCLLGDLALYYQAAGDSQKAKSIAISAIKTNGINLDAVAVLQNLNSGEAKIYAAEYLLYNWKPVEKVKLELKAKTLPFPGTINTATESALNKPAEPAVPVVEDKKDDQKTLSGPLLLQDFKLGPITLGMLVSEMESILGKPKKKFVDEIQQTEIIYDNLWVIQTYERNPRVIRINYQSGDFSTPRGIKIGSTKDDVIKCYGNPQKSRDNSLMYMVDGIIFDASLSGQGKKSVVQFDIKNGQVASISVYGFEPYEEMTEP